jgi:hypothetical protein
MKRSVFLTIALLFALAVSAQKQEVIASAGGYNTATGISISWTLGETIIPTFKAADNSIILTHGFQQQLIITTVEENLPDPVKVTVYPNPASDILNIAFDSPVEGEVTLVLINSQGKVVKTGTIEAASTEKQINMQDVPGGVYYLRLSKGAISNVYKVVKL